MDEVRANYVSNELLASAMDCSEAACEELNDLIKSGLIQEGDARLLIQAVGKTRFLLRDYVQREFRRIAHSWMTKER